MSCGCSNNGSGCRNNGVLATMQTGDTIPVSMRLWKDGEVSQLWDGSDIIVGFYDKDGNLLAVCDVNGGRVTYDSVNHRYVMTVSHEESLLMKKAVYVELTVTEDFGNTVYHGDKVVKVAMESRRNNCVIDGEEPMLPPAPYWGVITDEDIDNMMED